MIDGEDEFSEPEPLDKIRRAKRLETVRDIQNEIGATLDRFHVEGVSAHDILSVVSGEVEIWMQRRRIEKEHDADISVHG